MVDNAMPPFYGCVMVSLKKKTLLADLFFVNHLKYLHTIFIRLLSGMILVDRFVHI